MTFSTGCYGRPDREYEQAVTRFSILPSEPHDEFGALLARCGFCDLRAEQVSTIQVNVGRMCNQVCRHCHIDAGPHRTEMMSADDIERVAALTRAPGIDTLDITGGAPEMNPYFRQLVTRARPYCRTIIDRCNLTILLEPGYEDLGEFLAAHQIEIVASLPCYEADNVDTQRGNGVFDRSIEALKLLNSLGYGRPDGLVLNLIYNPVGAGLAPQQKALEAQYKKVLFERFGISFNGLFAMNNVPVNRFETYLRQSGQLDAYMEKLAGSYDPDNLPGLMCRRQVSIRWDGTLHDCDFNLIKGIPLSADLPVHVRDLDLDSLANRLVSLGSHCLACTAGHGSSCTGSLQAE